MKHIKPALGILIFVLLAGTGLVAGERDHLRDKVRDKARLNEVPGHMKKVVSVPEPGTLTLLALGIGGGLLVRSRRGRRSPVSE